MRDDKRATRRLLLAGLMACAVITAMPHATAQQSAAAAAPAAKQPGVLKPADMDGLMPAQVFYRGQSATVQMRNSGGVRFADGMLVLAALVDTSGYSSGVQQRYQAYLLTEVPLQIGDQKLAPGAYGVGFIESDRFVAMDIGDHQLMQVASHHDAELRRPTPLQVIAGPAGETYRLYAGRSYVELRRAQ